MSGHRYNFPWRVDGRTIIDSKGTPVAMSLPYTSLIDVDKDGNKTFNTSDYAAEIRVELIVDAINFVHSGEV